LIVNHISPGFAPNTGGLASGQMWLYDRFPDSGISKFLDRETGELSEDYIVMGTWGSGPRTAQTIGEVRIWAHDPAAQVGDQFVTIDPDTGATPELRDDRLYVPIRFVAEILGVSRANIHWDGMLEQVTIISPDGRTIQFQVGNEVYYVNGAPVSTWHAGIASEPFISELSDRFMVPFRALGQALGIEVDYDPVTREGIYHPRDVVPQHAGFND